MRLQAPPPKRLTRPLPSGIAPAAAGHYIDGRRDLIDFAAYRAERNRPSPPTPPSGGRAA